MKKAVTIPLVLSALMLAGCGNSAPKCSDAQTQDLVKDIAKDELIESLGQQAANAVTLGLEGIRTTDFSEKTGAQECAAELTFTGPAGTNKLDITYTSENTDDAKNFYVTVYGL